MIAYSVGSGITAITTTTASTNASSTRRENVTTTAQALSKPESTSGSQITIDPEVRGGVPCVGDNRFPITLILERLALDPNVTHLMKEYSDLTLPDIQLALDAAAWVMRDPGINWSTLNLPEMVDFQREMQAWQRLSDEALDTDDDSL